MAVLVAVSGWDPNPWADGVRAHLSNHDVRLWPQTAGDLSDIEYLLAWKPPSDLLPRLTNLKVIFSLGAGVDHLVGDPALPDVPIVRVVDPDLTGRMVEWVVFQVLLHHRQHLAYAAQQRARQWKDLEQPAASEVRVGILGLGVLGQAAATALAALGFKVAGWARTRKSIPGIETYDGPEQLDTFLARTDILVNLLPLTPDTRHLIDYKLVSKLAQNGALGGPVFINAGRGGSQVEADLVRALDDGTLKAASLDVFEVEPLSPDSPLWTMENVVITPHSAADSDPTALAAAIARQILAFERGEALTNLVDRTAGY